MDDFSGLEYDQESVSEEDVISRINNLLNQFNLPTQVKQIQDITASLFVVLYESLFSDRLPGIIRQPVTREDEIHNCQAVIDVLSNDVIKDNLSHIRGTDIVDGKVQAINNLIDIFSFLFEYVIKQIESDVATDTEDIKERQDSVNPQTAQVTEKPERENCQIPVNVRNGTRRDKAQNNMPQAANLQPPISQSLNLQKAGSVQNGNGKQTKQKPVTIPRVPSPIPRVPSPIPPDSSTSLMGHWTLNSTAELVREGEQVERQFEEKQFRYEVENSWKQVDEGDHTAGAAPFDFIGMRPPSSNASNAPYALRRAANSSATSASAYGRKDGCMLAGAASSAPALSEPVPKHSNLMRHRPASDTIASLSSTMPLTQQSSSTKQHNKLRSTVGSVSYHTRIAAEKPYQSRDDPVKGLSSSYNDLHEMVQQTAAMTRAALGTSPVRMHRDRAANLDITDLSGARFQIPPSEAMNLARDLNFGTLGREKDELHPYCISELVNKLEEKEKSAAEKSKTGLEEILRRENDTPPEICTPPSKTDYLPYESTDRKDFASSRSLMEILIKRPDLKKYFSARQQPSGLQKDRAELDGSRLTDTGPIHGHYEYKVKDRYRDLVDDVLSTGSDSEDFVTLGKHRPARKSRDLKLSHKLEAMGKRALADAQRHLESEDDAVQLKKKFLRKMYEEEYDDLADEIQNQEKKERRFLRALDEEYRKLMDTAGYPSQRKAKATKKHKGYLTPKRKGKRSRSSVTTVARCKSPSKHTTEPRDRPLVIDEDEDLMPVLLEEFPHLYMSEHTWHELWRRGIGQIENLTRAYEESKRRKSKAQLQMEEAARKHEVLANIVRKQMENSKRMRDLQEQKTQQVMLKNKMHEKRVQSARARRYYNDYQVRARSKMLKRRTREEMIFRNLFKDGLAIQKERLQDIRRYAKSQRQKQSQKRQDEIESLENFYRDQFELLLEKIAKDRQDVQIREKAHQKVVERMRKDLRRKMEKEILEIQTQLFRDEDDSYFRQLDADRLLQELQMARYQARI